MQFSLRQEQRICEGQAASVKSVMQGILPLGSESPVLPTAGRPGRFALPSAAAVLPHIPRNSSRLTSAAFQRARGTKMPPQMNAEQLNRLHRAFWADTTDRRNALLSEQGAAAQIAKLLHSELVRGVAVANRYSFEGACEEVRYLRQSVRRSDGLRGGRRPGGDRLQRVMEALLFKEPGLCFEALKAALADPSHHDVIAEVEADYVSYEDDHGRCRDVRNRALRARFYRARQKVSREKGIV